MKAEKLIKEDDFVAEYARLAINKDYFVKPSAISAKIWNNI